MGFQVIGPKEVIRMHIYFIYYDIMHIKLLMSFGDEVEHEPPLA